MSALRAVWSRYGAGPGQLLATVASLTIAAAAVVGWTQRPQDLDNVLIWFVAAIVLHDIILLPIYTLADRVTIGFLPARAAAYIRVPTLISGIVLAATFPTVFGFGAATYLKVSDVHEHDYLVRWLILTGALFALSGLAFALRGRKSTDQ